MTSLIVTADGQAMDALDVMPNLLELSHVHIQTKQGQLFGGVEGGRDQSWPGLRPELVWEE